MYRTWSIALLRNEIVRRRSDDVIHTILKRDDLQKTWNKQGTTETRKLFKRLMLAADDKYDPQQILEVFGSTTGGEMTGYDIVAINSRVLVPLLIKHNQPSIAPMHPPMIPLVLFE